MRDTEHQAGYAPVSALQHSSISRQFYYWLGASGERYLHTVFSIDTDFNSVGANFIIVRKTREGERIPLHVGRVGELTPGEIDHLRQSSGANEVHIHLMASSDAVANKIALDLDARHMEKAVRQSDLFDMPASTLPAVFFANVSF